jgi:hypothetical protein
MIDINLIGMKYTSIRRLRGQVKVGAICYQVYGSKLFANNICVL